MDHSCHECGEPQTVWMVARCTNPSKGTTCGESFCFKCLGQTYPQLYGGIFKGLWWLCPACMGICKCETCTDPVKKAEFQRVSKRKLKQRQKPAVIVEESTKLKLRSGTIHNKQPAVHRVPDPPPPTAPLLPEEPDNGWICSRCSTLNNNDDIECLACCCHRKRNTRKRSSQEPLHEVDPDKFHTYKETRRATENNDDKVAPVKLVRINPIMFLSSEEGRVSALRQLVKKPWVDGWDQARKLALELVEEAIQIGLKQGAPMEHVRQLPTKYQLANVRATHVRKWFDREPTLAKKFLRAADFVYSKSNGTFLKDHVRAMDDLPHLIRQVDASKLPENGESDDEGDSAPVVPSPVPSSPATVDTSPSLPYHDLQVRYHQPAGSNLTSELGPASPLVFHVPITDLSTMDELHAKLNDTLHGLGLGSLNENKLALSLEKDSSTISVDECTSIADLSRGSLLHVHAS